MPTKPMTIYFCLEICRANLVTLQIIDAVHNSNFEEYIQIANRQPMPPVGWKSNIANERAILVELRSNSFSIDVDPLIHRSTYPMNS